MKTFRFLQTSTLLALCIIASLSRANSLEVQVAYDCGEDLPKILEIQGKLHLFLEPFTELEVFVDTETENLKKSPKFFLEIESKEMAYLWQDGDSDVFDCAKP